MEKKPKIFLSPDDLWCKYVIAWSRQFFIKFIANIWLVEFLCFIDVIFLFPISFPFMDEGCSHRFTMAGSGNLCKYPCCSAVLFFSLLLLLRCSYIYFFYSLRLIKLNTWADFGMWIESHHSNRNSHTKKRRNKKNNHNERIKPELKWRSTCL